MEIHFRGTIAARMLPRASSGLICLALLAASCKSVPVDLVPDDDQVAEETASAASAGSPDSLPTGVAALQSADWRQLPESPFAKRDARLRHWEHRALEGLIHAAQEERPDLTAALSDTSSVAAANAAIVAARWGDETAVAPLAESVRNQQLPSAVRCAAAETLGWVASPTAVEALRASLESLASGKKPALDGLPELHAEMLRALARHQQADDEKYFTAALRNPAWQVRFEAITAWGALATDRALPPAAVDSRSDNDPRVRSAALRTIGAHHDPHSLEYLREGLSDETLEVHLTAIAAVGELGTDDARKILAALKTHSFDLSRAATIGALAAAGMRDEVEAAAKDTSSQVRLAVAQTLSQAGQQGQQVAAQTVVTAQGLARDANADVQQQAIDAIANWPLEQAGPVLLLAIADGDLTARKRAAAQLADRWPAAAYFPIDGSAEERAAAVAQLKERWLAQYSQLDKTVDGAKTSAEQAIALSTERTQELTALVDRLRQTDLSDEARQQAIAALEQSGPELIVALESGVGDVPVPPAIYQEVLPNASQTFLALKQLTASDVEQRREAAAELAVSTATIGLSPLALDRLAQLIATEKDPRVWRSALAAIRSDTRESAERMAYGALNHASSEVRAGGCEYLAAHGDPRHAEPLMAALQDPDRTVVLAAVRALGAVKTLEDREPLVHMLASPDKHLQLEAALSLARLGGREGMETLERLAADQEPEIRLQSAQAMGEVADELFVPALMNMLADQEAVQRAALASLIQVTGTDVTAKEGLALTNEEKVRLWQVWYRESRDRTSPAPVGG